MWSSFKNSNNKIFTYFFLFFHTFYNCTCLLHYSNNNNKHYSNNKNKRSLLAVTASTFSFSKKNGPKSALNSDSFCVRRLFNVCVRVFCASNATILLVYIAAKIKMSFIWKDDFLFCQNRNISQRCSSVYTKKFVQRKDKTNYLSNQTLAKYYHSRNKH